MIRSVIFAIAVLGGFVARAQEFGGRSFPSAVKPAASSGTATSPGTSLDWKTEKKSAPLIPESKIDMSGEKPKYVNQYIVQPNSHTKPAGSSPVVSPEGIKELGSIRTHFDTIILRYRDWGAVDGDVVKIRLNGAIVARHITLKDGYARVELKLQDGMNAIDFKAMSSGEWGPATSEYEIADPKGNVLLKTFWDLEELQTGTLKIEKY